MEIGTEYEAIVCVTESEHSAALLISHLGIGCNLCDSTPEEDGLAT